MNDTGKQQIPASHETRTRVWRLVLPALLTTLLLGAEHAVACPVCFGDPDSEMARGAMWGILVLGIVVYGVLMGMVGIGVTWFIRSRKHID